MRILLLGAGAIALTTIAAPASAQSRYDRNANGVPDYRERAYADLNGNGILDYRERTRVDINRNGIADWNERFIDMNRNRIDDRRENYRYSMRWGANACPPGLAKKNNGCLPPGQANRLFAQGQRVPRGYNNYTPYTRIPSRYYNQYNLRNGYRYIYRDNYIYEVDPTTLLVRRIINLMR